MKQLKSISISKQFYSILKGSILNENCNDGDKLPSIRELASEYDISKTTVSSTVALLENEGLVEIIQGKGIYVRKKDIIHKMIGVLLFNFQEETKVEAGILKGIQQNLGKEYVLSMMDTANNMDTICRNADYLVSSGAQGLIILPPKCPEADERDAAKLRNIISGKIPVVFLLRDIECAKSDFISVSFGAGIYKAVDYLLKEGKRKIAFVLHDYQAFALQEMEAYKKAYHDNKCIYDPKYVRQWGQKEEIKAFLGQMINDVDAFIASDQLIYDMREVILSRGRNNGKEDLFIVGINNDLFMGFFDLPARTIHFPGELIGRAAVSLLADRMEGRGPEGKVQKVFEAEINI